MNHKRITVALLPIGCNISGPFAIAATLLSIVAHFSAAFVAKVRASEATLGRSGAGGIGRSGEVPLKGETGIPRLIG